jgi:hypothetical protein
MCIRYYVHVSAFVLEIPFFRLLRTNKRLIFLLERSKSVGNYNSVGIVGLD